MKEGFENSLELYLRAMYERELEKKMHVYESQELGMHVGTLHALRSELAAHLFPGYDVVNKIHQPEYKPRVITFCAFF